MADSSTLKKSNDNEKGLILYQYYPSLYCQKVVFALQEKKLKYKSHVIDLFRGDQFEPWFLKVNPKCEVPVLKDGVKVIPDSRRIIDYIEDNFSNGDTPRLMPEKGSAQYLVMQRMRDLMDNLPMQLVTFGVIFNPSYTGKMNMPPQELQSRQNYFTSHQTLLSDLIVKHKDFKDYYLVRIGTINKLRNAVKDVNEVEKALLDVECALKEAENLLATHTGDQKNWWLCCEKFTVADISLCLVLHRLHLLGLSEKFFVDGQFSHLQDYFKRVQQRDSYKKTVHQGNILKAFASLQLKEQALVTVGGVAVAIAAIGIATFLIHRHK